MLPDIQTVLHSDGVPEKKNFFEQFHFVKKISKRQQNMENYPAGKEFIRERSLFEKVLRSADDNKNMKKYPSCKEF